jgi:hypothetical protein
VGLELSRVSSLGSHSMCSAALQQVVSLHPREALVNRAVVRGCMEVCLPGTHPNLRLLERKQVFIIQTVDAE